MPSIDAQQIFPKRLGIMNGDTLVLEYYYLLSDKFKKHAISFNPQNDAKTNIEEMFKNSKHIPFLKRVDPKHIKAVLEGQRLNKPLIAPKNPTPLPSEAQRPSFTPEPIFKPQPPEPLIQHQITPEEEYGQSFQDFQASLSIDKQKSSFSSINKPSGNITSQQVSSFSKTDVKPEIKPKSKQPQIQSKNKQPQIKPKVKQPQIPEENQYEEDFEFFEQEDAPKPKKESKKEKKEQKQQKSEKSKQKKQKKQKGKSKDKKKSKQPKKSKQTKKQQNTVEDQFDFL